MYGNYQNILCTKFINSSITCENINGHISFSLQYYSLHHHFAFSLLRYVALVIDIFRVVWDFSNNSSKNEIYKKKRIMVYKIMLFYNQILLLSETVTISISSLTCNFNVSVEMLNTFDTVKLMTDKAFFQIILKHIL